MRESTSRASGTLPQMESSGKGDPLSSKQASARHTLALTAVSIAVVVALAVALPSDLWFLALVAAFVVGSALERYRQARAPAPPTLSRTPAVWWTTLTGGIDPVYVGGALLLIVASAAILALSSGGEGTSPTAPQNQLAPPRAGPSPTVKVRNEAIDRPFTAAGATFRVALATSAGWARAIEAQTPGPGRRWVTLSIEITNLSRSRFNPALLSYRLRSAGTLYSPDRGGVVGPNGLGTQQGLPRGASAEERLAFRVPAGTAQLALAFEPTPNGQLQLQVVLPSS